MRNPLKRITVIFVVIALLPVGFILYELSALTENEKIVKEIYQNQLDAILYSINQYSDDVLSSWANRFNIALMEEKNLRDSVKGVTSLLTQYSAIRHIYLHDLKDNSTIFNGEGAEDENATVQRHLDSLVQQNKARINQLVAYEEAGFRKMELMDTINNRKPVPVFFVLNSATPTYRLGAIVVD